MLFRFKRDGKLLGLSGTKRNWRGSGGRWEAHETAPLFKADSATLSFYATKDGKITVSYQGWDQSKVVLDG